ncbi:hypothetical protein R6Q57_007535 [Mikania cordata]
MDEKEGSYICANDGELQSKHIYCITATIADESSSTSVTIFDQAAKTLIGISCFEMVVQQGYKDPRTIPPAIIITHRTTNNFPAATTKRLQHQPKTIQCQSYFQQQCKHYSNYQHFGNPDNSSNHRTQARF